MVIVDDHWCDWHDEHGWDNSMGLDTAISGLEHIPATIAVNSFKRLQAERSIDTSSYILSTISMGVAMSVYRYLTDRNIEITTTKDYFHNKERIKSFYLESSIHLDDIIDLYGTNSFGVVQTKALEDIYRYLKPLGKKFLIHSVTVERHHRHMYKMIEPRMVICLRHKIL